jgi:hypothetical protein
MTSNVRNLIIGAIVVVVIGVGVAVAAGGGSDDTDNGTEVATTPIDGDEETTDGSGDGSSGGGSSGGSSSGGSTGDGSGSSQGGNPDQNDDEGGGDEAPPPAEEEEQTASAPTVNLISQNCNSGKLIAGVTANASNAYRKGVKSVKMERQNDEGAYLSFTAQWLGPETGAGNVWNGTLNYGNNFGKTLRVTATSDSNQTTTTEYAITVPC